MAIYRLTRELAVNPAKVLYVRLIPGHGRDKTSVVILRLDDSSELVLPEDISIETALSALRGRCHYRKKWLDETGEIDVCVQHDEISDTSLAAGGPYRFCKTADPLRFLRGE